VLPFQTVRSAWRPFLPGGLPARPRQQDPAWPPGRLRSSASGTLWPARRGAGHRRPATPGAAARPPSPTPRPPAGR